MMDAETEVSFIPAFPGWEVLYYIKGGQFTTTPVVSWAVHAVDGAFVRAAPVTADVAWSLDDDRPLCAPEGDVTHIELQRWPHAERWPTVWEWLADMKRREIEDPQALPAERPVSSEISRPVVLDNYRQRFARPSDSEG